MAVAPPPALPVGRDLTLAGRGRTFVREVAGPPGAPTLLLLHGWMVTADLNWFTCFPALGERFRVVAVDHRGHGRGIRSWRPFRLEDCADDAAAVLDELGVGQVIPVGYSMGGAVAQLLWQRHPERVAGLVLCATSRSFSAQVPGSQLWFAGLLGLSLAARLAPKPLLRQLLAKVVRRRAQRVIDEWGLTELERSDTPTLLHAGWAIGRFRSEDWIPSLDVPAAVVVNTGDQVVSPQRQLGLAAAIPGATVHEVDAGHTAVVTHRESFVPALVDACAAVARRANLMS
ncbi:MAG: alpha/beta hydrolase [Actinomycetota bacterium]|nr:alpha/beta hydrolase [Actinomycetota bacterium]